MPDLAKPANDSLYDSNGRPSAKQFQWLLGVTDLDPIMSEGSPEGVVEAREKRLYIDKAGASGSVLYVKTENAVLSDRTKGWILV